jgi:hypothetical protein
MVKTAVRREGSRTTVPVSAGAAYVFVRSGTTWSQQAYLKASNAGMVTSFGYSVAISGETVVVGALFEDSSATEGSQTTVPLVQEQPMSS